MFISRASLRVYSKSLSLDEISTTIGSEPCYGHNVGDSKPKKPEKKYEETLWGKRSYLTEESELTAHLSELLDFMERNKHSFLLLKEKCDMDFFCYLGSENGQGGVVIPPCLSRRLSAFNLNLVLDVYLIDT